MITMHPQDFTVIVPGAYANFMCGASGIVPLTFTWWRSTSGGTPMQLVSGGTPQVLFGSNDASVGILNPPPSYDGNTFYCEVSDGTSTVMSDTATLTVQSKSTMTFCFTHDCTHAAKLHYRNLPFFLCKIIYENCLLEYYFTMNI